MNHSETINELSEALSKAQGQIKGAIKDSANPFFKSSYADLSSIWDACREALSSNGLSIIQSPEESERGVLIETMLCHSSGQWISSKYVMPVSKTDAQAVGSAITYGRRYALAAMVGVAPSDDDGNAASKAPPQEPDIKFISTDQVTLITDLIKETKSDLDGFLKFCGGAVSVEKIPERMYLKAKDALEKKRSEVETEDIPQ